MRIIAGQYRGRPIKTLKTNDTRPTTDRVREALMSSLYSLRGGFEGARVLDAFAGSGALGLECLSRGATYVLFCEQARDALKIIQQNIASLNIPRVCYRVRGGDTFSLPSTHFDAFDLLFFDPPYAFFSEDIAQLLFRLDEAGMVSDEALICYECAKKDKQSALVAFDALKYQNIAVKDYGDTSLITLRKERK